MFDTQVNFQGHLNPCPPVPEPLLVYLPLSGLLAYLFIRQLGYMLLCFAWF